MSASEHKDHAKSIEILLETFGITKNELAVELRMAKTTVYQWIDNPKEERYKKIISAFEILLNRRLKKANNSDVNEITMSLIEKYGNQMRDSINIAKNIKNFASENKNVVELVKDLLEQKEKELKEKDRELHELKDQMIAMLKKEK